MAIKNYTSDKPIDRIFAELQQTLGTHGAKQISYDYGDDGKVQGVHFVIKVSGRFIPIKLPARVEKAQAVLKKQWEEGLISHKRGKENTYGYDQAYRVAWRNILDWVQAQMALLKIGMANMEEVFLPYMQDRQGVTFYEAWKNKGSYSKVEKAEGTVTPPFNNPRIYLITATSPVISNLMSLRIFINHRMPTHRIYTPFQYFHLRRRYFQKQN